MLYPGLLSVPFSDRRGLKTIAENSPLRSTEVALFSGGIGISLKFRSWIRLFRDGLFVSILLLRIEEQERIIQEVFGESGRRMVIPPRRILPFLLF